MVNGETFAKKKSAGSQEAIILLGHGSRVPEAGKDMERVAARLREKYGYPIIVRQAWGDEGAGDSLFFAFRAASGPGRS
jgi:hypothetical protein